MQNLHSWMPTQNLHQCLLHPLHRLASSDPNKISLFLPHFAAHDSGSSKLRREGSEGPPNADASPNHAHCTAALETTCAIFYNLFFNRTNKTLAFTWKFTDGSKQTKNNPNSTIHYLLFVVFTRNSHIVNFGDGEPLRHASNAEMGSEPLVSKL